MSGILISLVPNSELPRWIWYLPSRVNSVNTSGFFGRFNSLVIYLQMATLSIAGTSLELFLRRLLGNQKCQSRVMTSPTVKTKEIGQSAGVCLSASRRAYGVSPRDYQTMGPRKLVTSNEGLRYSPALCESMGISAGVGSAFPTKC
jgi:hypothetical protein